MKNLKYSDILRLNKELGVSSKTGIYNISVLSNITINHIKEIIEYHLRSEGINAEIQIGDYDNIVQDSLKCKDSKVVIIFWELCNLIEGFQSKIELYDDHEINAIVEKTKSEIDFIFDNLKSVTLVLLNKFTSFQFFGLVIEDTKMKQVSMELNRYLADKAPANVKLIDLEKVIANIGLSTSLDWRYFYSSKALYTIDFYKTYSRHIRPYIMAANGKTKKVIVFDCDGTLWKGILGEDGPEGIEMSSASKDGLVFSEIQDIAVSLNKQGVLIGLCSKNNPADVDKIIKEHPDMKIRDENIAIKKVNWSDKANNLSELAGELNIGIESIVFVDDSPFEVNLIREKLSEVTALQVPGTISDYPQMLRENLDLFYNLSFTEEDKRRTRMYKEQAERQASQKKYFNIESYLSSLGLRITVFEDNKSIVPRMSQMSQKTNQFNLTTKRYTENDIERYIEDDDSKVFFSVVDKFGDNGLTGLCITEFNRTEASVDIDTFIVSCRIIGRNIEHAFMNYIVEKLKGEDIVSIYAKYCRTSRNEQVREFYDRCGFELLDSSDSEKSYKLHVGKYDKANVDYIEVIDG